LREKYDGVLRGPMTTSLRLWLRLLSCTMTIEKAAQRLLAERFGTTLPRFDVLAALDHHDGLTMGELSREILVSNGNVTAVVRQLQRQLLVDVRASQADRRISIVTLTADGRRHFAELATAYQQWVGELLDAIADDDQRELFDLLAEVKSSIETVEAEEAPAPPVSPVRV
jgi:DNA-binding MarR family transcriptional regulator